MRGRFLIGLVLLLLSACSGPDYGNPDLVPRKTTFAAPKYSDAEGVWRRARLAIPVRGSTGSLITTNDPNLKFYNLSGTNPGVKWPVVMIYGGCQAIPSDALIKGLAEQGFVVLQLDSRHRLTRPLKCDPGKLLHARAAEDMRDRQATLNYALKALEGRTWADQDNIFIIGMAEAAPAVAYLYGARVKGRVLAEWDCGGAQTISGLRDADKLASFAVTSAYVPALEGGCSRYFAQNPQNRNLTLPMLYPRDILAEPIVFTQMLQFFDQQMFR